MKLEQELRETERTRIQYVEKVDKLKRTDATVEWENKELMDWFQRELLIAEAISTAMSKTNEESGWSTNKSSYYDAGGVKSADVWLAKLTHEQLVGACLFNVLKYAMRCNHKGQFEDDVRKIRDYAVLLNKQVNGD